MENKEQILSQHSSVNVILTRSVFSQSLSLSLSLSLSPKSSVTLFIELSDLILGKNHVVHKTIEHVLPISFSAPPIAVSSKIRQALANEIKHDAFNRSLENLQSFRNLKLMNVQSYRPAFFR